jgi:hypothetical protein
VADHHELKRRSTDIYRSYVRIMRAKGEDVLPRETFNARMNALKRPNHASILKAIVKVGTNLVKRLFGVTFGCALRAMA